MWTEVSWFRCLFRALVFRPGRLQRGDGGVQEHQLHGVGRRWAGQNPAPLEALLPEHAG